MKLSEKLKDRIKQKYGPWALVTGASSGIGKELAIRLAESGLNLVITARNETALVRLKNKLEQLYEIRVKVVATDLSILPGVHDIKEAIDGLTIGLFVASAGYGTSGPFLDNHIEDEADMLQVNTTALMMLSHYIGRLQAVERRGGIVLMSSIVAFQGVPQAANYAASKAYVQSLGEGLYHELKPYNVDVLTVAPGPVSSGFASRAGMEMKNTLQAVDLSVPILKSLGKTAVVFPGRLTKILLFGLRMVPRWGKVRIMKLVMGGMTEHRSKAGYMSLPVN